MIPETFGALLALLGLVAPGLVFELRRERRRQGLSDSAFREASRTAIASLGFTTAAVALMAVIRAFRPTWVVDIGAWATGGTVYFASNTSLIVWNGIAAVAIAVGLAVIYEAVEGRNEAPSIEHGTIWSEIFKHRRSADDTTWVALSLKSGHRLYGFVDRFSVGDTDKDADLLLVGPDMSWLPAPSPADTKPEPISLNDWEGIHVRSAEVEWIRYQYHPAAK